MPFTNRADGYKPLPGSGPWVWRQWRDIPVGVIVARFSPYTTDPDVRKNVESRITEWSYTKREPQDAGCPTDWCMIEERDLPPETNEWGEVCY